MARGCWTALAGCLRRENANGVFCTSGHTFCEREAETAEEWNRQALAGWRSHAQQLRDGAKDMKIKAKQMLQRAGELDSQLDGHEQSTRDSDQPV